MITDSEKYIYTTPAETLSPLGRIIPVSDAVGGIEPRMEDVCYLTEMARERSRWSRPAPFKKDGSVVSCISAYSPDVELTRNVLYQISDLCKRRNTLFGANPGGQGVIPASWSLPSGMTYPIIRVHPHYAIDDLLATMSFGPGCSPGDCGADDDIDVLRRAYFDMAEMKRFVFHPQAVTFGWKWDDVEEFLSTAYGSGYFRDYCSSVGPVVSDDGDSTTYDSDIEPHEHTDPGYRYPYFNRKRNGSYSGYRYPSTGSLSIGVMYDFYGLSSTQRFLPSTLNGWANFTVSIDTSEGSYAYVTMIVPIVLTLGETSPSEMPSVQCVYNIPFSSGVMFGYWNSVNTWASLNVEGYSSDEQAAATISLEDIFIDTGVVNLNSEIDSANWPWTPS